MNVNYALSFLKRNWKYIDNLKCNVQYLGKVDLLSTRGHGNGNAN